MTADVHKFADYQQT